MKYLVVVLAALVLASSVGGGSMCNPPTPTGRPTLAPPTLTPTPRPTLPAPTLTPSTTSTPTEGPSPTPTWYPPSPTPTITPTVTSTPAPTDTPTPSPTPVLMYACSVRIYSVDTEKMVVIVRSDVDSEFAVDINFGDPPVSPWKSGGAVPWVKEVVLENGLHEITWSDYFTPTPSLGQEACINCTCRPLAGYPVIYWGQDYEMILAYMYLPIITKEV